MSVTTARSYLQPMAGVWNHSNLPNGSCALQSSSLSSMQLTGNVGYFEQPTAYPTMMYPGSEYHWKLGTAETRAPNNTRDAATALLSLQTGSTSTPPLTPEHAAAVAAQYTSPGGPITTSAPLAHISTSSYDVSQRKQVKIWPDQPIQSLHSYGSTHAMFSDANTTLQGFDLGNGGFGPFSGSLLPSPPPSSSEPDDMDVFSTQLFTNVDQKPMPHHVSVLRTARHAPTKANACQICGKRYARPSTLKTHLRTHSGEKPYNCNSCGKAFSQAANLSAHLRTHTGEKPFKCRVCSRKFSQSSSVTTHMRTHSGERPYKCHICQKAFADTSTLTKHIRVHSGEKPYKCKVCAIGFSQSGNLNRHMRTHRK